MTEVRSCLRAATSALRNSSWVLARMVQAPRLSFPDPNLRQVIQSTTIFHTWVEIVNQDEGPVQTEPKESPQYGGEPEAEWKSEPTVSKTSEIIKAVRISEPA